MITKLTESMKFYMKNKNDENVIRLKVVRMAISALKNEKINLKRDLSCDEEITILRKEIKLYNESLESAINSNSNSLMEEFKISINEIEKYVPELMSEEKIVNIVKEDMLANNIVSTCEKGKLMKIVMPKLKGKADGKLINKIVSDLLSTLN